MPPGTTTSPNPTPAPPTKGTPDTSTSFPQAIAVKQFIDQLSAATGLNKDVVSAWVLIEGAFTSHGTGGFNYLNLRAKGGGAGYSGVPEPSASPNGFAQFGSVEDAVTETAYWINQFSNYAGIRASTKLGPQSQIAAIAASPWDAGHYNGGRSLLAAYQQTTHKGSSWISGVTGAVTSAVGSAASGANGIARHIPGVAQAEGVAQGAADAAKGTAHFFEWIFNPTNWLRVGYVLAGGVLVGAGVVLMAKSVGASVALPSMPSGGSSGGSGGSSSGPDLGAAFAQGEAQGEAAAARAAGRASARKRTAFVTGEESPESARAGRIRSKADRIGGDIPY